MLFVAKYNHYKKTKVIRIPEAFADLILDLAQELDSYTERTKDDPKAKSARKVLNKLIDKVRNK